MTSPSLPIAVIGAGPVGLISALGLAHHNLPVAVFEEDATLSRDTKAGTILARTVEVLQRFGAESSVLAAALRIDEIGEIDRQTNEHRQGVLLSTLVGDTRHPYALNIPQHHLEPLLSNSLDEAAPGSLHLNHRLVGMDQLPDRVRLTFATPDGPSTLDAAYVLACDGGRSTVRRELGITVSGTTLEERYMLVDLDVDLDIENPRDFPYLSYFGDPSEWMIVVRLPHCWRLLYPLPVGAAEPTPDELISKARRFIGDVEHVEVIGTNVYSVHHRVAERLSVGRIFLLGDAAHLITPMWALGLNSGVLDASNLPWRLAWVLRDWADPTLLDGYAREQGPLARHGAGEMAEAARQNMARTGDEVGLMKGSAWGVATTRSLLGVRLDVDGSGDWSMTAIDDSAHAIMVGDRIPDLVLQGGRGQVYLHDLARDRFVALYFSDSRRQPRLPDAEIPGLSRFLVSRWDAPLDSGLRQRSLFDPGSAVERRLGLAQDTAVLVRPDGHVAAIVPFDPRGMGDEIGAAYRRIVGRP